MNEKIDLKEGTAKRGFDCNLPNKKCEECSSIDNCRWLIRNVKIEEEERGKEMPESKFMKEWKKIHDSSFGGTDYSICDVVNARLKELAELIDKHLTEMKEDKK